MESAEEMRGSYVCSFSEVIVKRKGIILVEDQVFPVIPFSLNVVKAVRGMRGCTQGDGRNGVCSGERRQGNSHNISFGFSKQGVITLL